MTLSATACGHRVYAPEEADWLPAHADAVVLPGDVWQLGAHRLVCGDSDDPAIVVAATSGIAIDAAVCDPPWQTATRPPPALLAAPARFVFTDNSFLSEQIGQFGPPTTVLVWDCVSVTHGAHRPPRQMKLCLVYGDWRYRYDGDSWDRRAPWSERRSSCTLPEVFRLSIAALHTGGSSHQKPVTWLRRIIGCLCRGDVLDPFAGTGTTLIACEQLGRRCAAVERDPRQCATIIARWERWTGERAVCLERL